MIYFLQNKLETILIRSPNICPSVITMLDVDSWNPTTSRLKSQGNTSPEGLMYTNMKLWYIRYFLHFIDHTNVCINDLKEDIILTVTQLYDKCVCFFR